MPTDPFKEAVKIKDVMYLSAAVVIITSGRDELEKCVNSVRCQTYPCSIYIFTDAILSREEYNALADKYPSCHVSYWATKIDCCCSTFNQ
jgi:hypothetical protein